MAWALAGNIKGPQGDPGADAPGNPVAAYSTQTTTLWHGTQAEYDALPTATKEAPGFIAVIAP